MWVRAEGKLVNCDKFNFIKAVKRQDGKCFVIGHSDGYSVTLSEHAKIEDAELALAAICNRMNRERK